LRGILLYDVAVAVADVVCLFLFVYDIDIDVNNATLLKQDLMMCSIRSSSS